MIESLRDNAASKMTALVERGTPRDLLDIYELCTRELLTAAECWQLWFDKNPGLDIQEAPDKVLFHVKRLELQRPLDKIQSSEDRARAATVRDWFKNVFCRPEAK